MAYHAPSKNCKLCPRLAGWREELRGQHPDWFNAPVPCFGNDNAKLLVMGLAPGLRGANRTGRPFTGDGAGKWLYAALLKAGLASGDYDARPDDTLALRNTMISNAVRCVPPENKPSTAEIAACRPFLAKRIASLANLRVIVMLGAIAHNSTLLALDIKPKEHPFAHNALYQHKNVALLSSYHCSQRNFATKRLSPAMLNKIFTRAKTLMG